MRTALRLLGTRYGIAVALIVIVFGIVGVGRVMTNGRSAEQVGPKVDPLPTPIASTSSNVESGDDALIEPGNANVSPSLSAGTPSVSTVANRFIEAWLKHSGVGGDQWRMSLSSNATPDLMIKLQDTDPGSVPADTVTGDITITDQGGSVWSAKIPVNGGTVTLRLVAAHGRWQVDGIDWEQS